MSAPGTAARRLLAALAVPVLLTGCGSSTPGALDGGTTPTTATSAAGGACGDLQISYGNGSMPAPYSYRWTLTVAGEQGTLLMQGGQRGALRLSRTFAVSAEQLSSLCALGRAIASDSGELSVGGPTAAAELTDGTNRVTGTTDDTEDVEPGVRAVVPAADWQYLKGTIDADSSRSTTAPPTTR